MVLSEPPVDPSTLTGNVRRGRCESHCSKPGEAAPEKHPIWAPRPHGAARRTERGRFCHSVTLPGSRRAPFWWVMGTPRSASEDELEPTGAAAAQGMPTSEGQGREDSEQAPWALGKLMLCHSPWEAGVTPLCGRGHRRSGDQGIAQGPTAEL